MATEIVKNNNNNVQFKLGEKGKKKGAWPPFPPRVGRRHDGPLCVSPGKKNLSSFSSQSAPTIDIYSIQ